MGPADDEIAGPPAGAVRSSAGTPWAPADGDRLPAEAVRLPADEDRLPADGFRAPADGFRPPADAGRLPVEAARLPADAGRVAAEGVPSSPAPSSAGTASDLMSMRQPVSLAASLAFCPSLPIASDSW